MTERHFPADTSVAADQPMAIVSTAYNADVVTVTWQAVSYTGCEGFVISIGTVGTQLDNFQIDDPKATSDEVDFTCNAGAVYQIVVEPIIRGRPKDSLASPPVGIPYPA